MFLPMVKHLNINKNIEQLRDTKFVLFADSSDSSDDEDADSTPAVQVTVKFSPRNLDKSKISQEWSHQQYLMKVAEEPWCETSYHSSESSLALVKSC